MQSRRYALPGWIVLLMVSWLSPVYGQAFRHLSVEDGLPSNTVHSVVEDRAGYIWIGTTQGLVRHDGYSFQTYRHQPGDSTSLVSNRVTVVQPNDDGTLWVGTEAGLSHLDPQTGLFRQYRHDPSDSTTISGNGVEALHRDAQGRLWIGTFDGGLNRYDAATNRFYRYPLPSPNYPGSMIREVAAIDEDASGHLWLGTLTDGIVVVDPKTASVRSYVFDPDDPSSNVVIDLVLMEDRSVWAATGVGALRVDRSTGVSQWYRASDGMQTGLTSDFVLGFYATDDGGLWVATLGGGLNRWHPEQGWQPAYRHDPQESSSLSHDDVRRVYVSRDGMIWVSTLGGGLNVFDPSSEVFQVITHQAGDASSLSQNHITGLHVGAQGAVWATTFEMGLNRYDPASGNVTQYTANGEAELRITDQSTTAVIETRDGVVWVGMLGAGLDRLDLGVQRILSYEPVDGDSTSLRTSLVQKLLEGRDGSLWIGSYGDGVNRYDSTTDGFESYVFGVGDEVPLDDNIVTALAEAPNGVVWVGTETGLKYVDRSVGELRTASQSWAEAQQAILALWAGQEGVLLWATESALYQAGVVSEGDDSARIDNLEKLLDIASVQSLYEAPSGILWLGLATGRLVRFELGTGYVREFGRRHGLPLGGFTTAVAQHESGTLYWGNMNGLVSLDAADLPEVSLAPQVHIDNVRLFGERLAEAISEASLKALRHDENELTFEYVGLHYADPSANQYQYRLVGYDDGWRAPTSLRTATYTNLPPGRYTFEVRVANSDGVWSEQPARLDMTIRKPWWQAPWAYLAYVAMLGAAFRGVTQAQRKRLLRKERERARERELEQAREIEKAYAELNQSHEQLKATQAQLIQQEKMASLGALTAGIAHEIKNPLNFINNFAEVNEELADDLRDDLAGHPDALAAIDDLLDDLKQNAAIIAQHGKRADGIVKSMMAHARSGGGEKQAVNLNALIGEHIDLAYHGKRATVPGFSVEIKRDFDEAVGEVTVLPQDLGRVVLNLLSNAFDAMEGIADATVSVTTQRHGDHIAIRVADNGPGMPESVQAKVFEPFFTTKPTGQGTGLGLSLSYDIITQGHGGTMTVESAVGDGAAFAIRLPAANTVRP
ncbi:MAG: two-component regulator propeller domain-containing protein [Bacteroidota bacterium]